ncbi:hypothetical protein [Tichowtungia aerotolerans]|uniref:Uncharacterized protein n=1 Tax=Tichowtungia aerotolerans TaxID=2697043 RepID=A0A6P1M9J1_9BACT|nr:hypothetical protein [Tichowtungia aerotolerans]QHI69723.1 hypothetical protein GT409_09760 [Tichowtungia aerotolerans]
MFKKGVLAAILLCNAFALYAQEPELIPWRDNITMLVVPREPQAVKLALDISRYYPVLIVCYQPMQKDPVLHAWNGEGWVSVSPEDYVNGVFFTTPPQQAVVVEQEKYTAPELLIPDGTWCKKGFRLSTTDERAIIHLLGLHFKFPYRYWIQFADRYKYALEEINPSLNNVFWWHYRGNEVMPAFKARDFETDRDLWEPLEITLPEPIEPVDLTAQETVEPAEAPAEEPAEQETQPNEDEEAVADLMETPEPEAEVDVETIIQELEQSTNSPAQKVDPFTTNDVPAAELVPLPTE